MDGDAEFTEESVALKVDAAERYYLPDVMLTCDERDRADRRFKRHPSLVAEVISPSSVRRDREARFSAYLRLPTLRYYVLDKPLMQALNAAHRDVVALSNLSVRQSRSAFGLIGSRQHQGTLGKCSFLAAAAH
ncbi:MAG: Uma2 family endonuclease [Catalinimonas sp.]